jgi:hypothetical protein
MRGGWANGMIKWLYFALAVVAVGAVLLLLNDLRRQMKAAAVTVNDKLPRILEKTEASAETLATLSGDIREIRDLAGLPQGSTHDRTLVRYADRVLDLVEESGGVIGTRPLIGGEEKLKNPQPAAEWVRAARKEALWQTLRAKSHAELLERLGENKFGSAWHIQMAGGKPAPLAEWVKQHLPDEAGEGRP